MTPQQGGQNDYYVQDVAGNVAEYLKHTVNQHLIAAIECYLGRVPSDDEVSQHAAQRCYPNHGGWDYLWDKTLLVEVRFHQADAKGGARWTITRMFGDDQIK